jgi:hypothetical protein
MPEKSYPKIAKQVVTFITFEMFQLLFLQLKVLKKSRWMKCSIVFDIFHQLIFGYKHRFSEPGSTCVMSTLDSSNEGRG